MEIKDYLTILWRRKWIILCTFLVTMVVVIIITVQMTPIYTASTMLRIATYSTSTISSLDYTYASRLKNTYVIMATTQPVLDELKQRLGMADLPPISVSIVGDTELLEIKVQNPDPNLAAQIVNTLAEILVSQSVELYTGSGESSLDILKEQLTGMENELNQARKEYTDLVEKNPKDTEVIEAARQAFEVKQSIYAQFLNRYEQARTSEALREKSIYIVEPATPPSSPSKPRVKLNIILGVIVGLMGGVGLAFLFENLDSTFYSLEQVNKVTKLPILGTIPLFDTKDHIISWNANTPYIDAFRRLRANLFTLLQDLPHHTILVTSSEPGEGKSTLVANLAIVLANAGKKVILFDCDLRQPTLHKIFGLPNEQGMSNIILEKIDIEEVLQACKIPGLKIVTSGPIPPDPADLLSSEQMSSFKYQLQKKYDFILLDSPPVSNVSDAILLTPAVDSVILVTSRSYSRKEAVLSACKQLADVNARILGVVFNRAGQNGGYHYYQKHLKPKGVMGGIAAVFRKIMGMQ